MSAAAIALHEHNKKVNARLTDLVVHGTPSFGTSRPT